MRAREIIRVVVKKRFVFIDSVFMILRLNARKKMNVIKKRHLLSFEIKPFTARCSSRPLDVRLCVRAPCLCFKLSRMKTRLKKEDMKYLCFVYRAE